MAFTPIDIELIKDSTDIVSVIQQFVELKRSGNSWKGLCPFHREKTPSFIVTPQKGMWKCFGCGEGGDVISFLMKQQNLSFLEVVEELAEQSGITLHQSNYSSKAKSISIGLIEAVEETQKFYKKCFQDSIGKEARAYLMKRRIDDQKLKIGIGYAPTGNALLVHLNKLGYSNSTLIEAGLVIEKEGSKPYDRFRNRLTFPIKDRRGRIVSFGARALGDSTPKYLNGPETSIYRKGSFLYGYSDAQREARSSGVAVLVEGYFDHARLLSVGIKGVVATSGTAFTKKQAKNFTSMAKNIVICYDGDAAGSKAAVKAAEMILSQGGYPRIIRIPDGMDPDDYISKIGEDAFRVLLNSPLDPIAYCINLLNGVLPEGPNRVKISDRLMQVVASASNPLVEEDLLKKVEKFTGYSRTALQKLEDTIFNSKVATNTSKNYAKSSFSGADKAILKMATVSGRYDRNFVRFLENEDMRSELGFKILNAFREQVEEGFSEVLLAAFDEDIRGISVDIVGDITSITSLEVDKVKANIVKNRIKRKRKILKEKLLEVEITPEQKAMFLEELADGGIFHDG